MTHVQKNTTLRVYTWLLLPGVFIRIEINSEMVLKRTCGKRSSQCGHRLSDFMFMCAVLFCKILLQIRDNGTWAQTVSTQALTNPANS